MTPADILLDHLNRIAGSEPRFYKISPDGDSPVMHVAVYSDYPEAGAVTGFTLGLSHSHPPQGGHKELTISMRGSDTAWALACGFLAYQLRGKCPFVCGDTINFHEEISEGSGMSGFLITHPAHVAPDQVTVDLGVRKVELTGLIPLYEQERLWLVGGGEPRVLLDSRPAREFMDSKRPPFVPANNHQSSSPWWRFWRR